MAKKHEFQPDKPRSSWLSKLYLTSLQRRTLLKWFLYGLVLLVLSVVQDVILCRFRLYGATSELVPCAIFLICILEGTHRGCSFALITSTIYFFTGTAAGPHAILLITALAIAVCAFRQGYLQPTFSSAMICLIPAMLFYQLTIFGVALVMDQTRPDRIWGFLITAGLSLLIGPLLYPLFVAIGAIGGKSWKE